LTTEKQFLVEKLRMMSDEDLLEFLQYQFMQIHSMMAGYEPNFYYEKKEIIAITVEEVKARMSNQSLK
jgi:hypothetical protein